MEINEFDDLMNLGKVTRTIKLLGKFEIELVTLGSGEYSNAMSRVPDGLPDSKRMECVQREMMAEAIKSINGKSVEYEKRIKILTGGQLGLSNLLYGEYLMMVDEQTKIIEGAKKNSSEPMTTSTASQKAPPSK